MVRKKPPIISTLTFILSIILLYNSSATSDIPWLKSMAARADELAAEKKYKEAATLYTTVLELRSKELNPPEESNQGDPFIKDVYKLLRRITDDELGLNNSVSLTSFHRLAKTCFEIRQYRSAFRMYEELRKNLPTESQLGSDSVKRARNEFEELVKKSLAEQHIGNELTNLIKKVQDFNLPNENNDFQIYHRLVSLSSEQLGQEHPLTIRSKLELAKLLPEEQSKEAFDIYNEIIPQLERMLGEKSVITLDTQLELAKRLWKLDRAKEGAQIYESIFNTEYFLVNSGTRQQILASFTSLFLLVIFVF